MWVLHWPCFAGLSLSIAFPFCSTISNCSSTYKDQRSSSPPSLFPLPFSSFQYKLQSLLISHLSPIGIDIIEYRSVPIYPQCSLLAVINQSIIIIYRTPSHLLFHPQGSPQDESNLTQILTVVIRALEGRWLLIEEWSVSHSRSSFQFGVVFSEMIYFVLWIFDLKKRCIFFFVKVVFGCQIR